MILNPRRAKLRTCGNALVRGWVLMYDVYGQKVHNFGFSETSDFVHFTPLGQFNQGVMRTTNFTSPKHGAIIHLTRQESERLAEHWGMSYDALLPSE